MVIDYQQDQLYLSEVLAGAAAGEGLTRDQAIALSSATGPLFAQLISAASARSESLRGQTVTYSRKVFIPLTTLCRDQCGYCTFVKVPGEPGAHTLSPEEVLAIARAGRDAGCKEALFSLGDRPELRHLEHRLWLDQHNQTSTTTYLRDMCELVFKETGLLPHANPGALSYEDLAILRPFNASMGIMLESTSMKLLRPGGAHYKCPDKVPSIRLKTIEAAGQLSIPFTTGLLIGIGETLEDRVDTLMAINQANEKYGHIQEVIVQNFRRKSDIPMHNAPEPTALEMLRTIALARLILDPRIGVQAPPNLSPETYQMYLFAGLSDWGGVSPVTPDHINPERRWPKIAELRRVSAEAGFTLRERLAINPRFALDPDQWLDPNIIPTVKQLIDESGLVAIEKEQR